MPAPRTVVIPFGVPTEGRGLGLGLAALVHAFVHVQGDGVALAQLHVRRTDEHEPTSPPLPVEAFVPPSAWRDIAGRDEARDQTHHTVGVVLTGSFEPPTEGQGIIRLLAFDSRDGRTCARVDAPVDDEHAGATLVGALEQLWSGLGGEIGALRGLSGLGWEPLESVLRAERCALHDPARGGPHDRVAAMLHLGRAIEEAPEARYPVERLASIATETALAPTLDTKVASAALRALERAVDDAPAQLELVEALGTLMLRLGRPRDAELRMNAAIAEAPKRSRPYALLAQALRAQRKLEEAMVVLDAGLARTGGDAALLTERGAVLSEFGDVGGAGQAWREALAREPLQPAAYASLAALHLRARDAAGSQTLIDAALAASRAHPDVLRRALQLALNTETDGLARAARVARLCERLLEILPEDTQASLMLARAAVALDDPKRARERLALVDRLAPTSAAAAEGQITRLLLDDPGADRALQGVTRAARTAPIEDLADVAARARRLATLHGAWTGWVAAAIAEQRRGRWAAARGALEVALETAPGATAAHLELATVLLELDDAPGGLAHAERAMALEGASARVLMTLARTLAASGRRDEAVATADRAVSMYPDEAAARTLAASLRERPAPPRWSAKVGATWKRWARRNGR
jgi:tetratricopeptide (TPR) repeat protein